MSLVTLKNVKAGYGSKTVLHDLSLNLEPGQILGLLGQNGAGKTTTIKLMTGLLRPKQGEISVFRDRPGNTTNYKKLGFAPEEAEIPEYLNGRDYLDFISSFRISNTEKRKESIGYWLDFFELDPKKKVREYSKGMNRRLILAQAFIGDPELLILDEPINGLDPLLVIKLREKISGMKDSGISLLYSSHLLAEIEKCCTHIAILVSGNLVFQDTLENCVKRFGTVEAAFIELNKNQI